MGNSVQYTLYFIPLRLFCRDVCNRLLFSFFYPLAITKPGWYLGSFHRRIKPNSKLKRYDVNFEVNELYF